MFCAKCGKEIDNEAKFCNYCGAPTPKARQAEESGLKKKEETQSRAAEQQEKTMKTRRAPEQDTQESRAWADEPKGGLSQMAKILMAVAIVCVAGAIIFAAVSLNGKKADKTLSAKAEKQTEAAQDEKESDKTAKASAESAKEDAAKKEDSTESAALPHEAQAETSDDSSASGADTAPALADKVITALKRPTFFDGLEKTYSSVKPSVPEYTVGAGLSNVSNVKDFYLNDQIKSVIEENGFAVVETNGKEFFSVYEQNRYNLLPNFVTVDSMMHVYHLYFSYLLKNTERNYLSNTVGELSLRMLDKSLEQRSQLQGTEWEDAASRNVRFFAVGAELLGFTSGVSGQDAQLVQEELSLIRNAGGIGRSPVFAAEEDYSQYTPRGYYEGDPQLEAYFRAMMWFGRMNFAQKDEDLDRSALLITMAMDEDVFSLWESVYSVTSFFAGTSDDNGYYEYKPVIDEAYGSDATVKDLPGNGVAWAEYHTLTANMPTPQINSVPGRDEGEDSDKKAQNMGFRFLGQRFSIDAAIFQNLIYSTIHKASDDSARMLPDALDIPAVMGSDEALSILIERGNTKYPNYEEKVDELRSGIGTASEALWSASLSSRWLYTLLPLTAEKGDGWPSFMQTQAWARKDLQTFLGSYAELKHDTVLYAKQAMAEMGGDAVEQKDDRGYVEPEPEVYARLSILTEATINGLNGYGILDPQDEENLLRLKELSDIFFTISEKELQNETLTADEYDIIRTYGGQLEHFWKEAYRDESNNVNVFEFPAAIITDVATDPNGSCLEIGTGGVNTIYVAVPVDGQIKIASGTVYSFYQFEQPLSERLTDTDWRYKMGIFYSAGGSGTDKAAPEDWTDGFTVRQNAY